MYVVIRSNDATAARVSSHISSRDLKYYTTLGPMT